jgi:hypothetical protein
MRKLTSVMLFIAALTPIATHTQGQSSPRVPLRTGLTIVTALNEPDKGDYESIKRFVDVNDKTARLRYSAEVQDSGDDNPFAAILGGGRHPSRIQIHSEEDAHGQHDAHGEPG